MSLKQNLAESAPLLGVLVAGFGMVWLGMHNMESDILSELSGVRTELSGVRTELSTLAQRVARIEGRLNIPPMSGGEMLYSRTMRSRSASASCRLFSPSAIHCASILSTTPVVRKSRVLRDMRGFSWRRSR